MNLITFIFGVIILIFAILQIVLFFKLWRMTNDVHLINENKQISSNDQEEILWLLRKYILLGDTNKAQEIIVSIFLSNIRKDIATNGITNCDIEKWKNECLLYYKAINKNIPEPILKIHSGIDVIKLIH